MLCDVLITLMCYRNPHINHCDPKSDLNSCFRMRLLAYDLKMPLFQLPYLYTIVLCIVGLFMTMLNIVGSWMARDRTIEWFDVLVVGAV